MRNLETIRLGINSIALYPVTRDFSRHDMGLFKQNLVGSTFGVLSHIMYEHDYDPEDKVPKILVQPHGGAIIGFNDVELIDVETSKGFSARVGRKELRRHYDLSVGASQFSHINPQAGYINAGPFGWIDPDRIAEIGEAFPGLLGKDLPRSTRMVPSDAAVLQTVFVRKTHGGTHEIYRVPGTYPTVGDPDWMPGPAG